MKEENITLYTAEEVILMLLQYESATRIYRAIDSHVLPQRTVMEIFEEIKPSKQ